MRRKIALEGQRICALAAQSRGWIFGCAPHAEVMSAGCLGHLALHAGPILTLFICTCDLLVWS